LKRGRWSTLCVESETEGLREIVAAAAPERLFRQVSRVRHAWTALTKAMDEDEVIKNRGLEGADYDCLLPSPELEDIEGKFWGSCWRTWWPDVCPDDVLISRLAKELRKKAPTVRDVPKTKSRISQAKATRERKQMTDGVEVVAGEPEGVDGGGFHSLRERQILMIARAKAGCVKVGGVPQC
jgi:hypothetical protein